MILPIVLIKPSASFSLLDKIWQISIFKVVVVFFFFPYITYVIFQRYLVFVGKISKQLLRIGAGDSGLHLLSLPVLTGNLSA